MSIATLPIFLVKVTLKGHHEPLKMLKLSEKSLKSNKKGSIRLYQTISTNLVQLRRLELPRVAPLASETSASTNSAIAAEGLISVSRVSYLLRLAGI